MSYFPLKGDGEPPLASLEERETLTSSWLISWQHTLGEHPLCAGSVQRGPRLGSGEVDAQTLSRCQGSVRPKEVASFPCLCAWVWVHLGCSHFTDEKTEACSVQGIHPSWDWTQSVLLRFSIHPLSRSLPRPGVSASRARPWGPACCDVPRRFGGQPGHWVDLFSLVRPVPLLFDIKIIGDVTHLTHNFKKKINIMSRL